eukprot:TRINITY_DN73_c0_g1_i13.p1 TRINITY_DN73_c0_g1~~TRINITY_DN73_c0_g1_i13.p1  ORF type:complete len:628 (-),score=145.17 TRINITY_DN73_c0_g1_i13:491-2374(-)
MSVIPTTDRPVDHPHAAEAPSRQSPAQRTAVIAIALLVGCFVLGALVVVVGPDAQVMLRRWKRIPVSPQVADSIPSSSLERSSPARPVDRSVTLAADAQISPPRRRAVLSQSPIVPLPDEPQIDVADATDPEMPVDPDLVAEPSKSSNPTSQSVDPVASLMEAAAELVNRSWQDFDYPVRWGAAETSKPRMIYANHRNRLLNAVAHLKPSSLSLEFARKDHAAALAQFDEDPRLDYVFGLALWKHGQFAEAIEMFQTAARLDEKPFLPAALAVAWGRFMTHDERRGLDQLHYVARVLAESTDGYPATAQKEQAAIAMGRAMGYLGKPGRVPELAETIELTMVTLRRRLPVELQAAYDSGLSDVDQRESELLRFVELPFEQLQSQHATRRDELQAKIDSLRTEMRDARNTVVRTRRTHVESIGGILKDATDLRGQMEKLRPTIKKLQESITKYATPQAHVEKKTMPSHFDLAVGPAGQTSLVQSNATMTLRLNETAAERATRISQLSKTRDELKKIQDELSKLREKQRDLVDRRNAEERQHRADGIDARNDRVARVEEQRALERELNQLSKALRRTKALHDGVDSIAAYIPWNVEIEAEALRLALDPRSANRQAKDGGRELSPATGQK